MNQKVDFGTGDTAFDQDVVRLISFLEHLPCHAACELALNIAAIESPSIQRDFYVDGLRTVADLTPDLVERVGKEYLSIALELARDAGVPRVVKALDAYYSDGQALPVDLVQKKDFVEAVRAWEACSDVANFCWFLTSHDIMADDPRDLGLCIQKALKRHNLNDVYEKVVIEQGEDANHFLCCLPIRPTPAKGNLPGASSRDPS